MTENELTLLSIIREHEHPEKAMAAAMQIICWFLMQHESSVKPFAADSRESA